MVNTKLSQNNAKCDKICYIGIDQTTLLQLKDRFMYSEIIQSLSTLYGTADCAALLFDSDRKVIWKNAAAETPQYAYAQAEPFANIVFTNENTESLSRCGSAYIRPSASLGELHGFMLTAIKDCVLVVFDRSDLASFYSRRFGADTADSYFTYAREYIDRLSLNLDMIERTLNSDDPEIEERFSTARMGAYQLLRSVAHSVLLSKHAAGSLTVRRRRVNVGELCRVLCFSAQSVLKRYTEIEVTVQKGPVYCNIDVKMFEQAFLNLLDNALQYTQDGNAITVTVAHTPSGVSVTVRDRGAGITDENLALAVRPYFSSEPAADGGPAPGLGLGLTTASIFCEMHGGTLLLNSRFGEGTTVVMSIADDAADLPDFSAAVSDYVTDRFSPLYVELCGVCILPR